MDASTPSVRNEAHHRRRLTGSTFDLKVQHHPGEENASSSTRSTRIARLTAGFNTGTCTTEQPWDLQRCFRVHRWRVRQDAHLIGDVIHMLPARYGASSLTPGVTENKAYMFIPIALIVDKPV